MTKLTDFIKKWQKPIIALIYFGGIWPLYVSINHFEFNHHLHGHILKTHADDFFPFSVDWIFIYASMYAIVMIPFVYIKNNAYYRRMFYAFLMVSITAFVIFLIYPTWDILRPELKSTDFARFFLNYDNNHDAPYNCFPSLHVGFSMMAAYAVIHADRSIYGIMVFIWALLVSVSVLYVKEHYFLDLIGGFALATIAFFVFLYPFKHTGKTQKNILRNRLIILIPLSVYMIEVIFVYVKYIKSS